MLNGRYGFYTWAGRNDFPIPADQRAKLRYKRFTMRDLWPEQGRFDWSTLDAELDRAARDGQAFALRLRDLPGDGVGVPEWIVAAGLTVTSTTIDTNKPITLPKYGPDYLAILRQFVQAVAQHCEKRNPGLLAIVDIGMLGRWGEGHFWGIRGQNGKDGTAYWMPPLAVQQGIVDMHRAAFGPFGVTLATMTEPEQMALYALTTDQNATWRRDSLGNKAFDEIGEPLATLMRDRARRVPAITEFFGNTGGGTNLALARQQAARWGVGLISNGNLGRAWDKLTPDEQAELLAMAEEAAARAPVVKPDPSETVLSELATLKRELADLRQTLVTNSEVIVSYLPRIAALEQQQARHADWLTVDREKITALEERRIEAETTVRFAP